MSGFGFVGDTSGGVDNTGITFGDVGVPPMLDPNFPNTSDNSGDFGNPANLPGPNDQTIPPIISGKSSNNGNPNGWLSGLLNAFDNVWAAVNPPQIGQINPANGVPYGINPATGQPYNALGFAGGNTGLLLIGGLLLIVLLVRGR